MRDNIGIHTDGNAEWLDMTKPENLDRWRKAMENPEWGHLAGFRFVETTPIQDAEDLRARALFYAEGRHLIESRNRCLIGVEVLDRLGLKYYHGG